MLFRSTFCILACDVDRTRLHPFESYPPLFVSCLFPRILNSSIVRQAFQMVIKYISTTAGAVKFKRYYEHIFGVTAIFRVSSQSETFEEDLKMFRFISVPRYFGAVLQSITIKKKKNIYIYIYIYHMWDSVSYTA